MKKVGFFPRYVIEGLEGRYGEILISITDPNDSVFHVSGDWRDFLRIQCHDIDKELPGYILFNKEHAKQIIDFLGQYGDLDDLNIIVHCDAGISRSAAVAKFVADFYKIERFNHKYSLYNKHIYRVLMEEWRGSIYDHIRETAGGPEEKD